MRPTILTASLAKVPAVRQSSWESNQTTLQRSTITARLASMLIGSALIVPLPSLAQTNSAANKSAQKPAGLEVINSLNLAAAVSACALAIEFKVPLETGIGSNAQAITYVITSQFGGQIVNTTPLQPEQILNGTVVQTVFAVKQGCYSKLNDKDQKFVDQIVTAAEKQLKGQTPAK